MTQVSFYLFEKSTEPQAHSACRLARKILKQAAKLWWYCPDAALQTVLDDTLWGFDDTSFIPHGIHDADGQVCISAALPTEGAWIVFNFSSTAISIQDTFQHIIEIIENKEQTKIIGREKFKHYRQLGISPRTFKL